MIPEARISERAVVCCDTCDTPSSDHNANEVSKDSNHCSGNKHKYQDARNPFFEIRIFSEEMTGIKQEANEEDDTQYNREDGAYRIGHIVDRIFDAADLGEEWFGK